jgi:hypothetical protein
MTIKQQGGIFGRNPTFNNVAVDGTLTVDQIVEKTAAAGISLDGVTLKDGNVVLANGKGIDFSATSGTGTSELFSDYEEGSFTPSLSFVGGSTGITHTLQYGSYRKIGDMVFVMGRIALSNKGSDTGQVRINLPYGVSATSGENGGAALVYGNNFTSVTSDNLVINGIGNTATASMFPPTTGSSLTDANILNNTDFIFNFSYIAS